MTEKEEQQKTLELRKKYPCIVQWGKEMCSYDYYIDNEVWKADTDNAPRNAVYKRDDKWVTTDDIQNVPLRDSLNKLLE